MAATGAAAGSDSLPSRLILRYQASSDPDYRLATASATQARIDRVSVLAGRPLKLLRTLATGALLVDVGDSSGLDAAALEQLADRLRRRAPAGLLSVEPDRRMQAALTPNDPYLGNQWALAGPAQSNGTAGVNAFPAWDITTGAGAVVAVIDTGYRPHADLASQVVAQYDFISDTSNSNDGNGRDADAQDPGDYRTSGQCGGSASTSSWHGTHVAGTIAAITNNSLGVAGVAFGSKLVIARVLGACGGYTSDISDAIVWASGGSVSGVPTNPQPANVINMSLGGGYPCSASPELQTAISSARSRNTSVVVAAGNSAMDASNFSPASCSGVIAVASVGETGARAYYSNYGNVVDIAAPGGDSSVGTTILSTYNNGATTPGADSYAYLQGTSMASPNAAGVVALLYSLQPALTPDEAETAITSTARAFTASCSGCGAGLIDATLALGAITPGPGSLSFGSASYGVAENVGTASISVLRGGGSAGAISVAYATANGTATAGSDYGASSGTLSWADGDNTAKTISVAVIDDAAAEATETVTLSLSSPGGGATLGSTRNATLSITDNDSAPGSLALSSAAYSLAENGGSVTITVTRSGGSNGAASVDYASANGSAAAGSDYTAKSGTLTWASRDAASKTFTIVIANDTLSESNETLQVRLSAASGASLGSPATATVTINDDDTSTAAGNLAFSSSSWTAAENAGVATITVKRSGGSAGAVTVGYASSNGTATAGSDYTAVSGTLSWANGDAANKTFALPISDDAAAEANETVNFTLSAPTGGATLGTTKTSLLSITDNDGAPGSIAVGSATYSVLESAGSVAITVTRTGGSTGSASIDYATANGSAVAGSDYTAKSGTLTWASGDAASKTFTIAIANDTLSESNETLQVRLSSATGASLGSPATATVTITDDDTGTTAGNLAFSSSSWTAAENAGVATITVKRSGGSAGAVTVGYASSNGSATAGSDYSAVSGTLSWANGDAANKTFTLPISDDAAAEANETVNFTLSAPTGGATLGTTKTSLLTITDNDGAPGTIALSSATYGISEAGGSVTITVSRSGGATGSASIDYTTANGSAVAGSDYTAKSGTLTWANGDAANKTFTVVIANDTLRETAETLQVRLSGAVTATLGSPASATVTITDND
ncbi:Calx-beta domain-containing protein [Hydrocarboniphaga sp.]|uniref:Calx-beta domain-containing protein n=1 Tax=Hydrocarboniphaga sp. TaxID=2033016 RepID=UPI00261420EA|nr:Calx-beta domain-containing protein [Hydrocarboniphaga sp.]